MNSASEYMALLDDEIVVLTGIVRVDCSRLVADDTLMVHLWGRADPVPCSGFNAMQLLWQLKPTALEGCVTGAWGKNAWWAHNLIGHPLMQILAFFGFVRRALQVHDATVPRPSREAWERRTLRNQLQKPLDKRG